jgi:hypothetical protein
VVGVFDALPNVTGYQSMGCILRTDADTDIRELKIAISIYRPIVKI